MNHSPNKLFLTLLKMYAEFYVQFSSESLSYILSDIRRADAIIVASLANIYLQIYISLLAK